LIQRVPPRGAGRPKCTDVAIRRAPQRGRGSPCAGQAVAWRRRHRTPPPHQPTAHLRRRHTCSTRAADKPPGVSLR